MKTKSTSKCDKVLREKVKTAIEKQIDVLNDDGRAYADKEIAIQAISVLSQL